MESTLPSDPGANLPTIQQALLDPLAKFKLLWRRKLEIISVLFLVVFVSTIFVFVMQPVFRATATLLVEPPNTTKVVRIQEVYEPVATTTDYQKTQYEILRSRALAERVIMAQKLEKQAEFEEELKKISESDGASFSGEIVKMLSWLPGASAPQQAAPDKSQLARESLVATFMDHTHVAPVPATNLVKISFDAKDPKLAALVSNELAGAYIRQELEARSGINLKASGLLDERIAEVKTKLAESEKALQQFNEQNNLVNVGGGRGLVEGAITDDSQRLRDARRQRTELENVYQRVTQAGGDVNLLQQIAVIQQEPLVAQTKNVYLEAQKELGELQSRYGAKHPKLIAAQARVQETRDAYYNQLRLRADGVRSEYEISAKTERSLEGVVERNRSQVQQLDRKEYSLQVLEREVKANREIYDNLLSRLKETGGTSDVDVGIARLVDPAVVPVGPYKPNKKLILFAATLAGLFFGSMLAFLMEALDSTIKNTQELEALTELPIIGVLPMIASLKNNRSSMARIDIDEPKSTFAEGMRSVRTGIAISELDNKRKIILVTSSVPSEGKSTVAGNLALMMGQTERVLLLDLDLRRPVIAANMGFPEDVLGLTDFMTGTPYESCVHRLEKGGIDVMPTGRLPANPMQLITTQRFKQLLKDLSERYDRIIVDTAPCQAVSDTLQLANLVDGVVFVVCCDSTPRKLVQTTVKQLTRARAQFLGAILNQVNPRRGHENEGGYYYSSVYYGTSKA